MKAILAVYLAMWVVVLFGNLFVLSKYFMDKSSMRRDFGVSHFYYQYDLVYLLNILFGMIHVVILFLILCNVIFKLL